MEIALAPKIGVIWIVPRNFVQMTARVMATVSTLSAIARLATLGLVAKKRRAGVDAVATATV